MIFLEFVCESLIGSGSGQYFECPFCESSGRSLYVRTRIQKYKCYRCDAWGDEFDLMRLFYPKEKLPRHRVRLDQLRQHFKAGTSLSPLGRGHLRELEQLIKDGEEPETLTFWDLKEAGYRRT